MKSSTLPVAVREARRGGGEGGGESHLRYVCEALPSFSLCDFPWLSSSLLPRDTFAIPLQKNFLWPPKVGASLEETEQRGLNWLSHKIVISERDEDEDEDEGQVTKGYVEAVGVT